MIQPVHLQRHGWLGLALGGPPLILIFTLAFGGGAAWAESVELAGDPELAQLESDQRYLRPYEPLKDWRGKPMRYCVSLPADFDPSERYPILLEWPGKGGGPRTQVFREVYGVDDHVHVGLAYPEQSRGGALLYATEAYTRLVRHVYDDVVNNFRGDPDHVFIGGFSAGGFMATGPGISLMIRAGLRDSLAGVLAGGCNWMSDPRYAHERNILLWYSTEDPNSSDLTRRLPAVREHAAQLKIIEREGAEHVCQPEVEGPAIRRFLARHGPAGGEQASQDAPPDAPEASARAEDP